MDLVSICGIKPQMLMNIVTYNDIEIANVILLIISGLPIVTLMIMISGLSIVTLMIMISGSLNGVPDIEIAIVILLIISGLPIL